MDKSIFLITSYIPSDENVISSNIYKLTKLGTYPNYKYIFTGVTINSGFGTGLEDYGHITELEAVLSVLEVGGFTNSETEKSKIGLMTLDEALEHRNNQINALSKFIES